jgi:ferritin
MLTEKLYVKMNEQVMLEFYSANLYMSMSSWCTKEGLSGAAKFLYAHSKEEMEHMEKLFHYINETGSQAIISAIDAPPSNFDSLKNMFDEIYKHEQMITANIFALADLALELKDYSTFSFLQWYTAEQHEEEALFKGIIDKIEIIGTQGRGLFMIDREIGKLLQQD